ncbi:MAG: deoxyribodipyrimidine photo-lyase [Candidatus Sumerlaeaceae bacterium]|nr:deoxyribodipyrimidine photo-lyase [Candidatus Sumerlaeaceae bacterium]
MIQPERIQILRDQPVSAGRYVLYWMQQAQRAACNHALEFAISEANSRSLPVVVTFGLTDDYPEANLRHYAFMLQGLADTAQALRQRGIQFVLRRGSPDQVAVSLSREAALLVADAGYLRIQRQWRQSVAQQATCPVLQVESDVIVPVAVVSHKEEFAARTIRPKIHQSLVRFLTPLSETRPTQSSLGMSFDGLDATRPDAILRDLRIDRSVAAVTDYTGGHAAARRLLDRFLTNDLQGYATRRNEPGLNAVSHMSPYLHFGQISPLEIALAVRAAGPSPDADAYLEELIVRRELSMNFVTYNESYDRFECLPQWAIETLHHHAGDKRPYVYSRRELEEAATHDPYWNAAQLEMVYTGKMHNYMRMYWGKKILEWTASPEEAFYTALELNNKYELDGRDANSFAGVAWCFGKHDRPWTRRPIFGTVRYMNDAGLQRKFDMRAYVRRVEALAQRGVE